VVTETSKESYQRLEDEAVLGPCQKQVYDYIKNNPECSLKDISEGTGLLQENVCGRKKYLEEQGLITKAGMKFNAITQRRVEVWVINDGRNTEQEEELGCLTTKVLAKIKVSVKKANAFQKNIIKGWCEN